MKTYPVGITPAKNQMPQTSFGGQVIAKGAICNPQALTNLCSENTEKLLEMLNGHNLIVRQSSKTIRKNTENFFKGDKVYKLIVSRVKENSILSSIADALHLIPRYSITQHYHRKPYLPQCIDHSHIANLAKKFKNN